MRTVSFGDFDGYWSPIAASRDLKPNKLLPLVLDGVPVVAFRDEAGQAKALVDRCPHRSVKLSIGKIEGGVVACSFHGWRYDGDGACRHIPLNLDGKLSAVRAQAVACREGGGLLWLYAGEAAAAPPLTMPAPLDEADWYGSIVCRDWPVHWSRGVQTMLDVAHIPIVHPNSIGAAFGRALGKQPGAQIAHSLQHDPDGGFRLDWRIASASGAASEDAGWVAFHPPHGMSLGIPQKQPERRSLLIIYSVPLTPTRSRTIVIARRNFGRYSLTPRIYDLLTPVILAEDRRNMETAWPSEVPPSGEEVSMPSDAPSIAFQCYYRDRFLKGRLGSPTSAAT